MPTKYEQEVREAEHAAALRREGLSHNEAMELIRNGGPGGPGTYANLGDIKRALGLVEPDRPKHNLLPRTMPTPEEERIAVGIEVMLGMAMAGYSTNKMRRAAAGRPCPYCHNPMVLSATHKRRASRDHLIPRLNGGTLARGNVLIVCQVCNGDKAARSLVEWLPVLEQTRDPRAPIVTKLIDNLRALGADQGGVAERLMAPDPKPGSPQGLASSNLAPSANSE